MLQGVAGVLRVRCSVLQCVAVSYSVFQCVAVCPPTLPTHNSTPLPYITLKLLHTTAVCCSIYQHTSWQWRYRNIIARCAMTLHSHYPHTLHPVYVFMCATTHSHACATTHSHVRHDAYPCVPWRHDPTIHTLYTQCTPSCVCAWHNDAFWCVPWCIPITAHIRIYVRAYIRTHMRGYPGCRVCGLWCHVMTHMGVHHSTRGNASWRT